MHVNLPLSVRTDLIDKGSKIIFMLPVDGNNRPKGDDEKTKQECLVAYGNGNG